MRPLILIFTFMYAFILSAQSSGGFTFRPRNLSIQKKGGLAKAGKTKPDNPAPAEVRFLTLRITTDLRAVFKTVLAQHLRVPDSRLSRDVLPGTGALGWLPLLKG